MDLEPGRLWSVAVRRERFSNELRGAADDVWEAMHEHPFVRAVGDGTLDPDRFRFYVRQDYLFLIDYARLLALGCARAPELKVS
jgi:thiaminase/transcriptional activator TenA